MNIVLVGYRGTGKSAVARRLGELLGWPVQSLDAQLVERAGQSIPEFVAAHGWPAFRDLEERVVVEAALRNGTVIDCGGGVVEREANFPVLQGTGPVVWLDATVATIVSRIGGDTQRPSLTGRSFTEEVAEVTARRAPLYERLARYRVQTDGRAIQDIAWEVLQVLSAELKG